MIRKSEECPMDDYGLVMILFNRLRDTPNGQCHYVGEIFGVLFGGFGDLVARKNNHQITKSHQEKNRNKPSLCWIFETFDKAVNIQACTFETKISKAGQIQLSLMNQLFDDHTLLGIA